MKLFVTKLNEYQSVEFSDFEVKDNVIIKYHGNASELVVPSIINGVAITEIGQDAFTDNQTVKHLTISEGITNIAFRAFWRSSITYVKLPNSMVSIQTRAFLMCSKLLNVQLPYITHIHDGLFWSCTALQHVEIPSSVVFIGASAFRECKKLTDIIIPHSVQYIDSLAFKHCYTLSQITIPSHISNISKDAFENCDQLKRVDLIPFYPSQVKNVKKMFTKYPFYNKIKFYDDMGRLV